MARVQDVAAFILHQLGTITAMKLQKLVFYSQAWSLVWDEKPLFDARIEAWAHGPVVPDLDSIHRGEFYIAQIPNGNPDELTEIERETVDEVLKFYGDKSSQWLIDLTHKEDPWLNSRQGLALGERGNHEITHADMAECYGSL